MNMVIVTKDRVSREIPAERLNRMIKHGWKLKKTRKRKTSMMSPTKTETEQ